MAVITNPKTGRMETVSDPTPIDLERLRRETKARIEGTEQFHVDPFAAPKAAPPTFEDTTPCFCNVVLGYTCTYCTEDA